MSGKYRVWDRYLVYFPEQNIFLKVFCNFGKWTGFDGSASPPSKRCFYFAKYIFMTQNQMLCT